ncbi:BTAD domain-containing putative transcriptional regulator [Amycolatopsis alkalitolerans]|uniref:AfsR/SARP family transcriptional regulator n=1 Tax=Amycolatopsis alkalitolerans TaxID=2547244 RepID=A0A5C4LU42_9PSEU|nr:BTAD domain-containing putative transcriptional regulator [Amycolatopsis alkalitolerans]TNC22396.1 AfsR/SARP family transcriptional regulator [Amycolatopsis alkalitolerans]
MYFGVLGPVLARAADGTGIAVGGPRPRALLALLLLETGRIVGTDRLIDELYGEEPPGGAANALQAQVSRLRRGLGVAIELHPAGYRLAVEPEDVDVHRFARLARDGRRKLDDGEPAEAARLLRDALALWRGAALADVDAPFAEPHAARLTEARLTALEDRAEAELTLGEADELIGELQALAKEHPLRERTRGLLMRALTASGRQAEALAVFEDTRRILADELGADPSPGLAAAHLAALRAEPLRTTGVPAQLTSFVGRESELERITGLLAEARLVTLTGPGGAGKTRLAIEASAPGACFVDLAPASGGSEVPQAVLDALGLREQRLFGAPGGSDPVRRLVSALADRALVLVVDNCEHVIDAAAALVHRLLGGCPGLRVLATSREPLGITGEALCPVPPLPETAAMRLFADRAAAVAPGVALDESAVRRICTALDGLPLAIELAAARLRTIPLAQLETRLDDRFRLLSRGSRTAAPRHQTLRAVVAWSWDLLGQDERNLLRRLAVFTGGITVDSAAQVCGLSEADDLLTGLAEKSLIDVHGERFRMLDTIRAYALEQLTESGELAAISRAHATYFLDLAATADPHLRRAEQLTWLASLAAEHANLHAALRWAVAEDDELALRLVGALTAYWRLRGVLSEVSPLAAQLVTKLGHGAPPGLEEEYVLAVLTAGPSEVDRHRAGLEAIMRTPAWPPRQPYVLVAWALFAGPPGPEPAGTGRERLATAEDPWVRALSQFSEAYLGLVNGRIDGAAHDFLAALNTFRQVGDRWGIAQALDGLASAADLTGDPARAVALTDEALALLEQLEAFEDMAELWTRRGDRLSHRGDLARARADYQRAAGLARRAGVPTILAAAHLGLGTLARREGDLAAARRWCERALDECGTDWQGSGVRAHVLTALGRIASAEGDFAGARSRHQEAVRIALAQQPGLDLAEATEGLATLAAASGETGEAAYLLGLAESLRGRATTGDPDLTRLRDRLAGDREFARGTAAGTGGSSFVAQGLAVRLG